MNHRRITVKASEFLAALRRMAKPITEHRTEGMGTQAGVVSRPRASMRERRATEYAIWAYSPVPLAQVVEAAGDKALRLRTVQRDGVACVPLHEIGKTLGREMVERLRPQPMWMDVCHNIVVNEGLDHSLNVHFLGSSYTAAWYIGLTDGTPTGAAADTIASHGGWTEVTGYSETYRQTLTLGAVSSQSVSNTASKGTFSISTAVTVGGAFLISGDGGTAKGGSTNGTMYGVAAFTGGDRSLADGDSLTVTLTLSAGTA